MAAGSEILLTKQQHSDLSSIAQSRALPAGYVFRAKLILMLAEGASFNAIKRQLQTTAPTIVRWKQRFRQHGLEGLDTYHPGQKPRVLTPALRARILSATRRKPSDGSTHWSCRKLASALGVSKDAVHRVWQEAGLKPHRLERYMTSDDPESLSRQTLRSLGLGQGREALKEADMEEGQDRGARHRRFKRAHELGAALSHLGSVFGKVVGVGPGLLGVVPQTEIVRFGVKTDAPNASGLRNTHQQFGVGFDGVPLGIVEPVEAGWRRAPDEHKVVAKARELQASENALVLRELGQIQPVRHERIVAHAQPEDEPVEGSLFHGRKFVAHLGGRWHVPTVFRSEEHTSEL